MNTLTCYTCAALALTIVTFTAPAKAGEQDAIDGCIDRLRAVGGPDGGGCEVIRSEYSEAATEVILRDAGGTTWRCLAYSDGTVGDLAVMDAMDDGGGAMAGAYSEGAGDGGYTATQEIRFAAGRSSGEFNDGLTPGSSTRWTLRAREGQDLNVIVSAEGAGLSYQIFNPDNSFLLEQMSPSKEYKGQLWQSGTHVIEVINRGDRPVSYTLWVGIE